MPGNARNENGEGHHGVQTVPGGEWQIPETGQGPGNGQYRQPILNRPPDLKLATPGESHGRARNVFRPQAIFWKFTLTGMRSAGIEDSDDLELIDGWGWWIFTESRGWCASAIGRMS